MLPAYTTISLGTINHSAYSTLAAGFAASFLAFAPSFQANLRARYQWSSQNGSELHVMPYLTYSSSSSSDVITINNAEVEAWGIIGATAGMARNNWSAELFVDNILNKQAQLASSFVYDRSRVSYARPMTIGLRLSLDLN